MHTKIEVIKMNSQYDQNAEMPAGLRMALTGNLEALNRFSNMSQLAQESFIYGARHVSSKEEMQSYVNNLVEGSYQG